MARKPEVIIASIAIVLSLAALVAVIGASYARPAAAQSVGVPGMRQITVVGDGASKATPNVATVQIGVETRAATSSEAVGQNSTQVAALLAKIKELGVKDEDVQTAGFGVSPDYDYEAKVVKGYVVNNQLSVTIRDLAKAGGLLDQVVQAGANNIYGLSFSVADSKAALADARQAALDDAKAKAQQLASLSGATLGEVLLITENIGSQQPVPMMAGAAEMARADVPVQAGSQSFNAQVQVTFALR